MGGELVDATGSYSIMWWFSVALGLIAMTLHLFVDESPVPEPPTDAGGLRIAPVAFGLTIAVAGALAAVSVARPVEATERSATAPPQMYCVLGPLVHDGGSGS